jgi:hypothetical protein
MAKGVPNSPPYTSTGSANLTIKPKAPTVTPKKTIAAPKGSKQVLGNTAKGQDTAQIFAQFGSDKNAKPLQLGNGIYSQGKEYAFTNTPSAEKDAREVIYYPGTTKIGKNGEKTCTGKVAVKTGANETVYNKICEAKIPGRTYGWRLTTEKGKTDLTTASNGTKPDPKDPANLTVTGAPTKGKNVFEKLKVFDLPKGAKVAMGGEKKPDAQVYGAIGKEKFHLSTQVVDAQGREIRLTGTTTQYGKDGITPIQQTIYTYTPPEKNGKKGQIKKRVFNQMGVEIGTTQTYTVGSESSTAGGRWNFGDIKLNS